MRTVAVLPVKTFSRAKHRLSEGVGAPDRRELAEAMARDVIEALAAVDALDAVVVVTAEPAAAEAAREIGAQVVHDDREAGQSVAAAIGVRAAVSSGAERALLVPGDCPALDPGEVAALLAAPVRPSVVIVPDRHGSGTNALLLTPPAAIAPSFGPGSFARHAARGRAAGLPVKVVDVASLGLDVDTPGDLDALAGALASRAGGAPRTRELIARLLPAPA
jgi:2-phospho-L-lactate/phosphoenolpyruvate guanylyltransferase